MPFGRLLILTLIGCVPMQENFAPAATWLCSFASQPQDDHLPPPDSEMPVLPQGEEEVKRLDSDVADEAFGLFAASSALDSFSWPMLFDKVSAHPSTATILLNNLHRLRI